MDISMIKADLSKRFGGNFSVLDLTQQKDEQGVAQPWLSAWFNTERVRVTFPEDVAKKVQADKTFAGLSTKVELVAAHLNAKGEQVAEYTRVIVITPNIDMSL